MTVALIGSSVPSLEPRSCPAAAMDFGCRRDIAVDVLAGSRPVSHIADELGVSRKFLYGQAAIARDALERAFTPDAPGDGPVLFHLPVTAPRIRQCVLALLLICHSSYRGVVELLRDVFGIELSLGTVHNIAAEAVVAAGRVNAREDLSRIAVGAHDEIFQGRRPVLVGADVRSTYCYLLSLEDNRDAVTWGVRLLECRERGLDPDAVIGDGGTGLRAGGNLAWPDDALPFRADVFHALRDCGQMCIYLENRALGAISARCALDHKMDKAKRRACGNTISIKLAWARKAEAAAVALADDLAVLCRWLREDVLSVAGGAHAERVKLYDWIVGELRDREPLCGHRIGPVRKMLENSRDELLAFVIELDAGIAGLAAEFRVAPERVRAVLSMEAMDPLSTRRGRCESQLHGELGGRFHELRQRVAELAGDTVRASSVVENLNSRLRNYFFLRKSLGPEYLELLRFFLNHRRFQRSEHADRVGKSPAEVLTGVEHPHWLELLGYQRFRNN